MSVKTRPLNAPSLTVGVLLLVAQFDDPLGVLVQRRHTRLRPHQRAGGGVCGVDDAVLQTDLQGALQHRLALLFLHSALHSWRPQTHQLLQHNLIGAFYQPVREDAPDGFLLCVLDLYFI